MKRRWSTYLVLAGYLMLLVSFGCCVIGPNYELSKLTMQQRLTHEWTDFIGMGWVETGTWLLTIGLGLCLGGAGSYVIERFRGSGKRSETSDELGGDPLTHH